jgi:hypothetical protein
LRRFLFGFYLGPMVSHGAPNRCTGDAMMTCHMSCHSADGRAFEATFSIRRACGQPERCNCDQKQKTSFHEQPPRSKRAGIPLICTVMQGCGENSHPMTASKSAVR